MEQTRSEVLKTIPYGFYITGVIGADGEANGFTTCWVSQVSFEPQQVIVAVRRDQHTHDLMERGGVFSLNFLDTDQEDLALRFTRPLQPENGAVGGAAYTEGETTGAPLFVDAFAHLECRVVGKMEATTRSSWAGSPQRPCAARQTSSPTSTPRWSTGARDPAYSSLPRRPTTGETRSARKAGRKWTRVSGRGFCPKASPGGKAACRGSSRTGGGSRSSSCSSWWS